jgi:hypothetical protein
MEVQGAFGGFGVEVGGFVANADGHGLLLLRLPADLSTLRLASPGLREKKV